MQNELELCVFEKMWMLYLFEKMESIH